MAIEDDPQAGWDHVSGYRTTAYVISPYTKRGKVVSTQYNHASMLRTIELILGLPLMNQMDATATPMGDCFTLKPEFTPYTARTNNIPLDQMNPPPKQIADPRLRRYARASARLPLDQVDRCPEALLNRILWHAQRGPDAPQGGPPGPGGFRNAPGGPGGPGGFMREASPEMDALRKATLHFSIN